MHVCWSVSPPFWSSGKYHNNYWMDYCDFYVYFYVPIGMNCNIVGGPLTLPPVTIRSSRLRFWLKCSTAVGCSASALLACLHALLPSITCLCNMQLQWEGRTTALHTCLLQHTRFQHMTWYDVMIIVCSWHLYYIWRVVTDLGLVSRTAVLHSVTVSATKSHKLPIST